MKATEQKFKQLGALGAGDFQHLNGSLEAHLEGTYKMLKKWSARAELCDAGLFHAAYGTDGFDANMVAVDQRQKIAHIIGIEAEKIVYLYCACDRQYVFERVNLGEPMPFKNRFTNQTFHLDTRDAQNFCELTVANELELVSTSSTFASQHGFGLARLFERMTDYLSTAAKAEVAHLLGVIPRGE